VGALRSAWEGTRNQCSMPYPSPCSCDSLTESCAAFSVAWPWSGGWLSHLVPPAAPPAPLPELTLAVCLGSGDSPHTGHLDNRHRSFVGLDLRDYETPKVGFALLRTNVPEHDETPMKTGDYVGYHSAPLCADMHRRTVPTDTAIDTGILGSNRTVSSTGL